MKRIDINISFFLVLNLIAGLYLGLSFFLFLCNILVIFLLVAIYITREKKILTLPAFFSLFEKYSLRTHRFLVKYEIYLSFNEKLIDETETFMQKFSLKWLLLIPGYVITTFVFLEALLTNKIQFSFLLILSGLIFVILLYTRIYILDIICRNTVVTRYLVQLKISFDESRTIFNTRYLLDAFYLQYPNDTETYWFIYLCLRRYAHRIAYFQFLKDSFFYYLHQGLILICITFFFIFFIYFLTVPIYITVSLFFIVLFVFPIKNQEIEAKQQFYENWHKNWLKEEGAWLDEIENKKPWDKEIF
jgi:hypothetical protein